MPVVAPLRTVKRVGGRVTQWQFFLKEKGLYELNKGLVLVFLLYKKGKLGLRSKLLYFQNNEVIFYVKRTNLEMLILCLLFLWKEKPFYERKKRLISVVLLYKKGRSRAALFWRAVPLTGLDIAYAWRWIRWQALTLKWAVPSV